VYSSQIHQEIARQRQAEMRREAHRERLAAIAAAHGPGKLARLGGVLASVAHRRRRVARRELAVG
jgi:hypothetical protein